MYKCVAIIKHQTNTVYKYIHSCTNNNIYVLSLYNHVRDLYQLPTEGNFTQCYITRHNVISNNNTRKKLKENLVKAMTELHCHYVIN